MVKKIRSILFLTKLKELLAMNRDDRTYLLLDQIVQRGGNNSDERSDKSTLIIIGIISALVLLFDIMVVCSMDSGRTIGQMDVRQIRSNQ